MTPTAPSATTAPADQPPTVPRMATAPAADDAVLTEWSAACRRLPAPGRIEFRCSTGDLLRRLKHLEQLGLVGLCLRPIAATDDWQITAFKVPAEPCVDSGRSARYRGGALAALDDDGHWLCGTVRLCEKTAARFEREPYRDWLTVTPPAATATGAPAPAHAPTTFCGDPPETVARQILARLPAAVPSASAEPALAVLHPGPFRQLLLTDGALLTRGQPARVAAAAARPLLASGELQPAPVADSAPAASRLWAGSDIASLLCAGSDAAAAIPSPPVASPADSSTARQTALPADLHRQLTHLVATGAPYLILSGTDPEVPQGCCPSTLVGAANGLVRAGYLQRWTRPGPADACPLTVYAAAGEIEASGERPQFKLNPAAREALRRRLQATAPTRPLAVLRRSLALLLIGFALCSLFVAAIPPPAAAPGTDPVAAAVLSDLPAGDAVVVAVFHGAESCDFCTRLEARCRAALPATAPGPHGLRPVILRTINYDAPAMQSCRESYGLFSAAVMLFDIRDSRITRRQWLEESWQPDSAPEALRAALAQRLAELGGSPP